MSDTIRKVIIKIKKTVLPPPQEPIKKTRKIIIKKIVPEVRPTISIAEVNEVGSIAPSHTCGEYIFKALQKPPIVILKERVKEELSNTLLCECYTCGNNFNQTCEHYKRCHPEIWEIMSQKIEECNNDETLKKENWYSRWYELYVNMRTHNEYYQKKYTKEQRLKKMRYIYDEITFKKGI